MKKICLLLTGLLLVVACKNTTEDSNVSTIEVKEKRYDTLEKLEWLVGNWSNISEKEQSYENWTQVNDSTLKAHSFTIVERDTVFAERVTLQQRNNATYFSVVAYNQNDDKPITFTLIPSEKETFTFMNPKHDFPSKITYTNPVKDSIHAWIEGTVKGENRKVDFYFTRN
tara:strand:- start:37061 stop:37570 length:510 start_codon:yes stop_codon:yes gene_type:complete